MRTRSLWGFAAAFAILGGCVDTSGVDPLDDPAVSARPVVIALLDTGIDAYHADFRAMSLRPPAFPFVDATTGDPARELRLTLGEDYAESLASDESAWKSVESRVLYTIPGTRLLAISFYDRPDNEVRVLDDSTSHGTATASIAAGTSPTSIVLMVEVSASYCAAYNEPCGLDPMMVEALEWVAGQPWIDVVSLSFGPHANHPIPEDRAFASATRAAVDAGKLVVAAAGNTVAPPHLSGIAGPPWVISAGGFTHAQGGEAVVSGKAADVLGNMTARVAAHGTVDGHRTETGTSMAAPRVAGVLARALSALSAMDRDHSEISPKRWKEALFAAARYDAGDWNPIAHDARDEMRQAFETSLPIVSAAPYAQMGWGYVDNATADEMVAILSGSGAESAAKSEAAAFISARDTARIAYWDRG